MNEQHSARPTDAKLCPHGVDPRMAHCCVCADPAFHAAQQPTVTIHTMTIGGEATANNHPTVCGWQRDEDGNDHTDCGGTWCLDDGTPPENDMKYCPYCGKLIGWCDYVPEEEDEPPEPDGECYRGGEAANALAEEQAWIQRNLK